MLAGRKLLLADDSITIQKVVDLTFADEGVSVISVSNGREAIEKLEEFAPDVVLADVFMPQVNGYEVCEYIKQNDALKHIPVMLLVGSFEPFDEVEARRVGADDTLTKPFQSIRRLIDKVGLLVGNRPKGDEGPTAELPKNDSMDEPEMLSDKEIEITTADTRPLPEELSQVIEQARADKKVDDEKIESISAEQQKEFFQPAGDFLLDLGPYAPASSVRGEDFVLDVDLDEAPEPSPPDPAYSPAAFLNRNRYQSSPSTFSDSGVAVAEPAVATEDQFADTQEIDRPLDVEPEPVAAPVSVDAPASFTAPSATVAAPASTGELSPEMIDAIARRAVELMSEKVVQEIAWEVVPDLAELMIKKQLEEKNS